MLTNAGTPDSTAAELKAAYTRARVVVSALLASVAFYIIIVEVLNRTGIGPVARQGPDVIRYVFFALAIFIVFGANVVRGMMLRTIRADSASAFIARLVNVHVVVAAIAQTPAVLGFVLFVAWRQYADFYMLAFVSVYLLLRHFPRLAQWERLLREYQAAAGSNS